MNSDDKLADISGVGVTVRKQMSALSSVLTVNLQDKFLFKSTAAVSSETTGLLFPENSFKN